MHAGPAFAELPFWRHLFWLSFGAWVAIEIAIWSRDRRRVEGRRDDRGSMVWISVAITAGIFGAFQCVRFGAARIASPPQLLVAAGLVFIWAGIVLRIWAVRTLGRYFRVTVTTQEDHKLVEAGPYRHMSNPAYTGGMLTLAGIGLAFGNWLSLASIVLLPLIGFIWRIRIEEASLAAHFREDFARYRRARWALVPFVW
ncbi:MAG TPA: isoprenylcysteine carboxylmethyltransferase family protein [Allosphingosinicella sp.]|jgi:protein-S-isoprenylcysteine O-methyltransferase Ste14